jgi:hypothetical protein
MSYFGNSGPAQDGGFFGSIQRGSDRLHNARVTRTRAGNLGSAKDDALKTKQRREAFGRQVNSLIPRTGAEIVLYAGAGYLMYRLYTGNRRRGKAPSQSPLYAIWS